MDERPGELERDATYATSGNLDVPMGAGLEDTARTPAHSGANYGTIGTAPESVRSGAPAAEDQTSMQVDQEAGRDPGQIRDDIERTRRHMSSTVDAIQDKLSPQHLAQEAKSAVRDATIGRAEQVMNDVGDTMQSAGNTLFDTIRDNPIPSALAAIGLGWLAFKAVRNAQLSNDGRSYQPGYYGPGYPSSYPSSYRQGYGYRGRNRDGGIYDQNAPGYQGYGASQSPMGQATNSMRDAAGNVTDKVQDVASNVAGTVQDAAGNVAGTAQQLAEQAQDQVQRMGYQAEWQMRRARNWLEETWESNPLALGAAALAAGAIIGGLLPETPMEDRLMGEARDTLLQKAEGVAQDTVQKAQSATEQALHQVREDVVGQPKVQPASGAQSKSAGQSGSQPAKQANMPSQTSGSSKNAPGTTPGTSQQTPPPTGEKPTQTQAGAR